jgi:hypothetical protein
VLECVMRTGSILISASLISLSLMAPSSARPLSIQRPVVRGITFAGPNTLIQQPVVRGITVIGPHNMTFRRAFHQTDFWPNRWRHRPGWSWRRYDWRFGGAWGNQAISFVPAFAGAYGSTYGVGPDAPYNGSAIYYPPSTKKKHKPHSQSDDGKHDSAAPGRLPEVVYGVAPETSASNPPVPFGAMPNQH